MPRARSSSLALLALVALCSCDSCERGGPVPFGLDAGRAPATSEPAPAEAPTGPASSRTAMVSRELAEGTASVEIEGAPIAVDGESVRAIGALDVDGDADRDAFVVVSGAPGAGARVLFARRDGASFGAPVELARIAAPRPECTVATARLRELAPERAVAEISLSCGGSDADVARVAHSVVLATGTRPRVLERLGLRSAGGDPEGTLTLRVEDRDGDGLPDLVADLALAVPGAAAADVSLVFLDRPAGLARDASEPEARIAALAQEARGLLRRRPDRAGAVASRALALWRGLCREPGRARLEIAGTLGVACGRSGGAGRALAVLAQAAARAGDPLRALEALEALDGAQVSVRDAERDAARAAFEGLASAGLEVREGPAVEVPRDRGARRSILAFVDEEHLLVRGPSPRIVALASGEERPADDVEGEPAMVDPSGRHRLVGIERHCEGTVLVVGPVDPLADLAGARRTALVAPRVPPPGAPCPDLTPGLRADDDGWRALGWAPQGVLVARGTELRVVPIDLEGRPAGAPVVIEPGAPIPEPISPGHATTDGRAYAYATPAGLVVVTLAPQRTTAFIRPPGWGAPEGTGTDVALSPSGRRVAWIAGGRVRWLERTP